MKKAQRMILRVETAPDMDQRRLQGKQLLVLVYETSRRHHFCSNYISASTRKHQRPVTNRVGRKINPARLVQGFGRNGVKTNIVRRTDRTVVWTLWFFHVHTAGGPAEGLSFVQTKEGAKHQPFFCNAVVRRRVHWRHGRRENGVLDGKGSPAGGYVTHPRQGSCRLRPRCEDERE